MSENLKYEVCRGGGKVVRNNNRTNGDEEG